MTDTPTLSLDKDSAMTIQTIMDLIRVDDSPNLDALLECAAMQIFNKIEEYFKLRTHENDDGTIRYNIRLCDVSSIDESYDFPTLSKKRKYRIIDMVCDKDEFPEILRNHVKNIIEEHKKECYGFIRCPNALDDMMMKIVNRLLDKNGMSREVDYVIPDTYIDPERMKLYLRLNRGRVYFDVDDAPMVWHHYVATNIKMHKVIMDKAGTP